MRRRFASLPEAQAVASFCAIGRGNHELDENSDCCTFSRRCLHGGDQGPGSYRWKPRRCKCRVVLSAILVRDGHARLGRRTSVGRRALPRMGISESRAIRRHEHAVPGFRWMGQLHDVHGVQNLPMPRTRVTRRMLIGMDVMPLARVARRNPCRKRFSQVLNDRSPRGARQGPRQIFGISNGCVEMTPRPLPGSQADRLPTA